MTESWISRRYLANAVFDAHRDDPEFGYRFLADEARELARRWRTGRRGGSARTSWWSAFGKKRGKNGKRPGPPVHDDLVNRDFTADRAEPAVADRHHRAPHR